MPDFSRRSEDIEWMDDLLCAGEVVHQTLRELEIINHWLGGNAVTLKGLDKLIDKPEHPVTIVDLGCGGGDMLKLIYTWSIRKKIAVRLIGVDANPHIIAFARNNCRDYPQIEFIACDVFSETFSKLEYDVAIGTLFFHHIADEPLSELLSRLHRNAKTGLLINDIHRHWLAYHSIRLLTSLFSRSGMVKFDAPLSVLRAFKRKELQDILRVAGIQHYTMSWRWAFRWRVIAFSAQ